MGSKKNNEKGKRRGRKRLMIRRKLGSGRSARRGKLTIRRIRR